MKIHQLVPAAEVLLAMEPEELAGVVLEYLNSLDYSSRGELNRYNFGLSHTVSEYPREQQQALSSVLMEGWVWLEREGLIIPRPGSQGEWIEVSRRGKRLKTRKSVAA